MSTSRVLTRVAVACAAPIAAVGFMAGPAAAQDGGVSATAIENNILELDDRIEETKKIAYTGVFLGGAGLIAAIYAISKARAEEDAEG